MHGSTRGACKTLNRTPHLSGPCRYFFHHSYRVLSLLNYPSLAGKTGGTRIDKYCTLIMPLVHKCKEQHALAHLYNRLARRLFARRRCGSCSVFEVTHSVNKYAPNKVLFRAQLKNFVIASMQSGATCLQGLRSVCIHVATPLKKAKP